MHEVPGRIVPGNLIINNHVVFDAALVVRYGLVVAVKKRDWEHRGCRTSVTVMWFNHEDPLDRDLFSDMCDCDLVSLDELGSTEVAVRVKRPDR